MSKEKRTLEIESDGISKEELFNFPPIDCPQCNGRGHFVEEIGRDKIQETPCLYCGGEGVVMCTAFVWWHPYRGKASIISNLKQFYHEMEKRGNC